MKRSTVKFALFVLSGALATSAKASQDLPDDLKLVEDLPVEQRLLVHEQVTQFLIENPELAENAKLIAVDSQGGVYVLDEAKNLINHNGQPSCGSSL